MKREHPRARHDVVKAAVAILIAILTMPIIVMMLIASISGERR